MVRGNVKYRFYVDSRDGEPTAVITACGNGPVTFSCSDSRDPDNGTIVSYRWDFGDGESASGMTVTHKYDKPGNYRVFLTVTDNDGKSDMTTLGLSDITPGGGEYLPQHGSKK